MRSRRRGPEARDAGLTVEEREGWNSRRNERRGAMRRWSLIALTAVLVLVAGACKADSGDDNNGGGGGSGGGSTEENTGKVNVFSALEPEENDVLQSIADKTINTDQTDYKVEFEQSADFEQQVQIRAQGGTLDVILLPQPGAVAAQAATGNAVSLEDM